MTTHRAVADITPITFGTDAQEVAQGVYEKLLSLLERLQPEDWSRPTECPAWDVADMVGHLIGAARANASLRETLRQQLWALRHKREFDGNDLDAMNALQVREHAALDPAARIQALRDLAPAAVAGRMRFPQPLRRVRVPLAHSGSVTEGMPASVSLGELMQVIYTRDSWLHRIDISRATGQTLDVDAVDARIVEDVVAAWARRHGQPCALTLTGPAGGTFIQGSGGAAITMNAIEFCRTLSGRAPGDGLLAVGVLF